MAKKNKTTCNTEPAPGTPPPLQRWVILQSLIARLDQALKEMAEQQRRFAQAKRTLLAEKTMEVRTSFENTTGMIIILHYPFYLFSVSATQP